jgi:hypothetical protein
LQRNPVKVERERVAVTVTLGDEMRLTALAGALI